MFILALKSLLGHKLRMFLTALSIIIGVSFVAGSFIFTDSINSTFETVFDEVYGSVDVIVQPKVEEFSGFGYDGQNDQTTLLPYSLLDKILEDPKVNLAAGELAGSAQLIDKDGELIGLPGAPTFGFSWVDEQAFNPLRLQEGGRPPEGPGEIVIDLGTSEMNDLGVGDSVQVQSDGPVATYEIVGVVSFGQAATLTGATISAFEFSEAQKLFGVGDGYAQISITAVDGVSAPELSSQIESLVDLEKIEVTTGDQQQAENLEEIGQGLGFLNTALLAFAGIAVFVGSFIIQNTFRIVVAQRSKELALLRAVGATRGQVLRVVLYEALVVGIISSLLGILSGIGLSQGLREVADATGLALPGGSLNVEQRTIWVSLAVGVLVTMYAALVPAIKASRVSPVEAMRENEASAPARSLKKRAFIGVLVALIGAVILVFGLFLAESRELELVGAGAAVMFIGVSVFAPMLTAPIANIASIPGILVFGVVGRIARQNAKRSPRRTASTASALMIGVSLVVFASVFASSLKATVDDVIGDNFPGDIMVTSKLLQSNPFGATFSPQVAEEVAKLKETELVSKIKYDIAKVDGNEELIIAVQPETFGEVFKLDPASGSYSNLTKLSAIYIKDTTIKDLGLKVGGTIDIEFAKTGIKTFIIADSFSEAYDSPYIISDETYSANFTNTKDLYLVANLVDGVSIEDGKTAIDGVLERYPILQAQDKNELISQTRTQIDQALGLLSVLLALAVLVAVLGIVNTLTLSVAERTREIGMLRAVGMKRSQVFSMISSEGVIIAVFGTLLGIVLGIFFAWAMLKALEDSGFSVFSIPVIQITQYVIFAVIAGSLAAIIPARRASRMNILDAINYE